jgi:hypothetical protein
VPLDFATSSQFRCGARLLAAYAGESEKHHDSDGEQKHECPDIDQLKSHRTDLDRFDQELE